MALPNNIQYLIDKIRTSKVDWRTLHIVHWEEKNRIDRFKNLIDWEKGIVELQLTVSKKPLEIPIRDYYKLLQSKDNEIEKMHLLRLFSLFEALIIEVFFKSESKKRIIGWREIKNILVGKNFITSDKESELRLAKCSRNCYLHNGDKINEHWLIAYNNTIREKKYSEKDINVVTVPVYHSEVDEWTDLIIDITNKIENFLIENHSPK